MCRRKSCHIRDEAHRFAITFHRELRGKAMTVSVLDEVEGVGPTRKRAIMRHFGSMKKLRAASADEIAAVKGVPRHVAEDVYRTLRAWDAEREAGRADGRAGEHADGHTGERADDRAGEHTDGRAGSGS